MKELSILLLLVTAPAAAAAFIAPTEASKHIGETATVEGRASVYQAKDGTTFVDLGGVGRAAPFYGVIFSDKRGAFPNVVSYDGRVVDISGRVRLYRGTPEIILERANQLKAH